MSTQNTGESKSYRDPMAQRQAAAAARRERLEAEYSLVFEVYDGFYAQFEPAGEAGKDFFASGESIIGSRLQVADGWLTASDGRQLVRIDGAAGAGDATGADGAAKAERLVRHIADGWQVVALISILYYRAADKAISAEIGFVCWDAAKVDGQTMDNFCKNVAGRLSKADHANLALTQEQFIRVIDSKGEWFLTGKLPYPARDKGTVVYKDHRSGTEGLVDYALQHNKGCNIAAVVFWIVLAAVIIGVIWWLFFR
jgi:hypothetical protein